MGKLTDAAIAAAIIAPGKGSCALQDGQRLFLRITPDGVKQWRLKYQVAPGPSGERMKVLGTYPAVSIEQARAEAERIRASAKAPPPAAPTPAAVPIPATIACATPPLPAPGQVPTFGTVAAHWAAFDKEITPAALYRKQLHVAKLTPFHDIPVDQVTVEQCIALHDQIRAESGLHTATRAGLYMSCIFEHATRWRIVHNPAKDRKAWVGRSDKKALAESRQDHITDPNLFGWMMEHIDMWDGPQGPTSGAFLRFIARVPVRASELAGARWSEFSNLDDPDKALWVIPSERMKQRQAHEVPLSKQAVKILLKQRAYVKEHYPAGSEYVFPHRDTGRKHIQGDNQKRTLDGLGWGGKLGKHSVHGFRHSFLTMAAEAGQSLEIADRCLAHSDGNKVRARYNMSVQLTQRRAMLQWWSDEIERMEREYKVPA
jgi:hypothetical protein